VADCPDSNAIRQIKGRHVMPMYEYFCPECNQQFEKLIRRVTPENAEGGVACPDCSGTDTRRVLSVIAAPVMAGARREVSSGGGCCGGSCGCGARGGN